MPNTIGLDIEHLQPNSDQPEVVVDAAFDAFDARLTAAFGIAIGNTNTATLTQDEQASGGIFIITAASPGPSGNCTVNFHNTRLGVFVVSNQITHQVTLQISGQAVTPPILPSDTSGVFFSDGVDVRAIDVINQPVYLVSGLPAASIKGRRAWVSDGAASPVFGSAPTGSGSLFLPVYDDGTTWRYG